MSDTYKQEMKELFAQADTSGDGVLSIQEVTRVMRACGSKLSDAELAETFVHDDTDGDRKMSFDEFWTSLNKREPHTVKEEELRKVFNEFDKDNNGTLTVSDMPTLFGGRLNEDALQVVISQADADGNSEVTFEEFVTMWKAGL